MSSNNDDTIFPPRRPVNFGGLDGDTVLPQQNAAGIHVPGDVIDNRYTVIREIGRGGMGVVYEVEDQITTERYAIKRLLPESAANDQLVRAFVREGTAAEKFSTSSGYFVTTKTVGRDTFGFYSVMELVTVPTLRQVLTLSGRVEPATAIPILLQLATALSALHGAGLIHRDLKPENIFVADASTNPTVKLVDFGLTREITSHTVTGLGGAGSLRYMAPEIFRDEPTTQASDIYAFGVIAYELVTGEPPIGMAQPVQDVVPEINPTWADLIAACLSSVREKRPQVTSIIAAGISPDPSSENQTRATVIGSPRQSVSGDQLATMLSLDVQDGSVVEVNGRPLAAPYRFSMLADPGTKTVIDVQVTWQNFSVFHGQVTLKAGQNQSLRMERAVHLTGKLPDWCTARTAQGPLRLSLVGLAKELGFIELLHNDRVFERTELSELNGDVIVGASYDLAEIHWGCSDAVVVEDIDGAKVEFPYLLPVQKSGDNVSLAFRASDLPGLSRDYIIYGGRVTLKPFPFDDVSDDVVRRKWTRHCYPDLMKYLDDLCSSPSGRFEMGSLYSVPIYWVNLSAFRLGRTPVTVGVWREYCKAMGIFMPKAPEWGWIDDHPVVNVSWADVMGEDGNGGFCAWASEVAGFRVSLPTEAQWEYACRGGQRGLEYPWGDEYDDAHVWSSVTTKRTSTAPVGRNANVYRNEFGLSDMAGNVCEWCLDYYLNHYVVPHTTKIVQSRRSVRATGIAGVFGKMVDETVDEHVTEYGESTDPFGPMTGKVRCVRGGSWNDFSRDKFLCANRVWNPVAIHNGFTESDRYDVIGFRLSAGPS